MSSEQAVRWLSGEPELDSGLFRAHFENLPAPAYIWKRCGDDFELLAHNRAALQLGNGDVKGLLGTRARELYADRPDVLETFYRCADEQRIVVQETNLTFVSGVIRRVRMTRIPMTADIIFVHSEDVTSRRASEVALAASEKRFRALLESQPDLIFRMDADGTYLDLHVPEGVTPPFRPDDIVGHNIEDLFGPEAAAGHRHYAGEAIRTGKVQVLEYEASVGGQQQPVESRIVRSGDNEVVVNIRDITERAELEQTLTETRERERLRLGRTLREQQARLQRSLDALKQVLRGPSTAPSAHAAQIDSAIATLEASVAEADELARDLSPTTPDTPIVAALQGLTTRMARVHDIVCRLTHDTQIPALAEQVPDVHRIAEEAIVNAVQHGHATHVELICTIVNDRFVLNIVDDGTGFRLSAADNVGHGMRIMRYRAKRLGGQLTRSRRVGGGTMVTCSFPIPVQGDPAVRADDLD